MYSTLFHYDPIATAAAFASAINVENDSICSAPIIPLPDVVGQMMPIFNCDYNDQTPTLITESNPYSSPIIDSNGAIFLTNQSSAINSIPQTYQHQNMPLSISSLSDSSNCCYCLSSSLPQSSLPLSSSSSSSYSLISSTLSSGFKSQSIPIKSPLSYIDNVLEKHSNKLVVNDKDKHYRSNHHHRHRHFNMNIFNRKIPLSAINHSEKRKNKINNLSNNKSVNLPLENRKQMVNIH